ncbi:uncharacterized protein [Antedon mediterranea]|uniref:uncharacterized protein n=1 Tax=Antedon mediterranea TaxID=105859 RepID=UPI003AF9E540
MFLQLLVLLVISVTVNVTGFLYFAIYNCVEKVLKKWKSSPSGCLYFHRSHANEMRIVYLDVIVGLVLPILAIVITFTSGVLSDRLKTSDIEIQVAFSVALGMFIFMLSVNVLVKSHNRMVNIVYDIVAITAFSVALCIQEEPFIGLIVMTSQGSRPTYQIQRLISTYWKRDFRRYGVVVFTNTVFTVVCNGVIPLLYLFSTIMQNFSMNSQLSNISIGFFYAFLIFFSFMNGWALCAVTDESRQCRKRNKQSSEGCGVTMRSPPGRTIRIVGKFNGGGNFQFPPLSTEILPPSYSQVVKESTPIVTCDDGKVNPVDAVETEFVSIPLQTQWTT